MPRLQSRACAAGYRGWRQSRRRRSLLGRARRRGARARSEEHTSELQSLAYLVCRLLLEKKKIAAREELIQNINKELRILDNNIYKNTQEIKRIRRQLDTLKQESAESLVFAYTNIRNYDYRNFIFSASNFNDAVKRITYLKSYRDYREQQVANIEKTEYLISDKIATLNFFF